MEVGAKAFAKRVDLLTDGRIKIKLPVGLGDTKEVAYISDITEAALSGNTFNANTISMEEFGLDDLTYEINKTAVEIDQMCIIGCCRSTRNRHSMRIMTNRTGCILLIHMLFMIFKGRKIFTHHDLRPVTLPAHLIIRLLIQH